MGKGGKTEMKMVKRVLAFFFVFILAPALVLADDYVIGDGDALQISVWGVSELSVGAVVRPDGKITIPGVGDVPASGYTPKDLSAKIADHLKQVVKKPIVTVTVTGITNNKIYIIGGGVASGVQPLTGRTTLLKFMSRFGNFKGADLEHAYLVRNGKKLDVDFYGLLIKGALAKDIALEPEDIIYVPDNESNKIYIMGEVNAPKYTYYRENFRILDAILEAGGFSKFANENKVVIMRKGTNGQMKEITAKVKNLMKEGNLSENILLLPGDFVIVKESLF